MRRHRLLQVLVDQQTGRLGRLEALARNIPAMLVHRPEEAYRNVSYITIDAFGSWSTFVREYFLACLLYRARRENGALVTHRLAATTLSEDTALLAAIRAGRDPRFTLGGGRRITPFDEPNWKKARVILTIARDLGFSNYNEIFRAMSHHTTSLTHFITVRNFFAHKSTESDDEVAALARRAYLQPKIVHPAHFVGSILPTRTDSLLSAWLAELRLMSSGLSQKLECQY